MAGVGLKNNLQYIFYTTLLSGIIVEYHSHSQVGPGNKATTTTLWVILKLQAPCSTLCY